MANAVYPSALKLFLDADIDLLVADVKVTLIDSDYTYSSAHNYYDDVPAGAIIATSSALGSKTTTNGTFDSADVTFSAVGAGSTVTGYILWVDTAGASSTDPLIAYYDTDGSSNPISIATSGGDITITVNASGWFTI